MLVLRCIADGPTYGYAIASELGQAGLVSLKGGVLYPLLNQLEQNQLVRTHWEAGDGGPGRKFYELTGAGYDQLSQLVMSWDSFSQKITGYLSGEVSAGQSAGPHEPAELVSAGAKEGS